IGFSIVIEVFNQIARRNFIRHQSTLPLRARTADAILRLMGGKHIIIKHNDDYLSAYAHNDTMLVREQQEVKAGQKIATMGSTGTS
ncbi:peptidoglycan DD-metalloendopeptidase family protein, partial [Salmonella enterica subsp. enterica serovar Anatum]|nr:peptidoglycan DD-metalloendopeptidase family protein [Salmonella enterica subsp. enterica serovar Anatum]